MFSRSPHYEWEWEIFTVNYIVIDGIWNLYVKLKNINKDSVRHKDRINRLCEAYEIPLNYAYAKEIVLLRNALFHEALWDSSQPCSGGSTEACMKTVYLGNLITRIIPAIFDYHTSFVKTKWWCLGKYNFDKRRR